MAPMRGAGKARIKSVAAVYDDSAVERDRSQGLRRQGERGNHVVR